MIFQLGNSKLISGQEQQLKTLVQEINKLSSAVHLHNKMFKFKLLVTQVIVARKIKT